MDFAPSPRAAALREKVAAFLREEIEPIEPAYHRDLAEARRQGTQWTPLPVIEELKSKARARGLWNLFLPEEHAGEYAAKYGTDGGEGLSNIDYAPLAEQMGRSAIAPLVFNCNAPDTGNMEVLLRYGSEAQRKEWLEPLLDGRIRSAFAMTEPEVASSDATNMEATCVVDGDEVVVNGRKWWSTGVGHPDCRIFVFMGVTDPDAGCDAPSDGGDERDLARDSHHVAGDDPVVICDRAVDRGQHGAHDECEGEHNERREERGPVQAEPTAVHRHPSVPGVVAAMRRRRTRLDS